MSANVNTTIEKTDMNARDFTTSHPPCRYEPFAKHTSELACAPTETVEKSRNDPIYADFSQVFLRTIFKADRGVLALVPALVISR